MLLVSLFACLHIILSVFVKKVKQIRQIPLVKSSLSFIHPFTPLSLSSLTHWLTGGRAGFPWQPFPLPICVRGSTLLKTSAPFLFPSSLCPSCPTPLYFIPLSPSQDCRSEKPGNSGSAPSTPLAGNRISRCKIEYIIHMLERCARFHLWAEGEGVWEGVDWQGRTQMWMWRGTLCSLADAAFRRKGEKVWDLLSNWPSSHKPPQHHHASSSSSCCLLPLEVKKRCQIDRSIRCAACGHLTMML